MDNSKTGNDPSSLDPRFRHTTQTVTASVPTPRTIEVTTVNNRKVTVMVDKINFIQDQESRVNIRFDSGHNLVSYESYEEVLAKINGEVK
jgi:hypothetical protein